MKTYKSSDPQAKPSVVMLVYGDGGVGKTTFASTAPKPLLADCENGAKFFGLRGIDVKIANIEQWADMKEYYNEVAKPEYETVIIDPVGELMEKLKRHMVSQKDKKLVQNDGSPSMAGWGWLKTTLRTYIKALRDMNKHVILIAHVEEKDDEGRIVKRPKVETKLSSELVNLVDIVAFMEVVKDETGEEKRVLRVDPVSDKFIAKDRTGQLGKIIPPDFQLIVNALHGNQRYEWMKPQAAPKAPDAPATPPAAPDTQTTAPATTAPATTTPPAPATTAPAAPATTATVAGLPPKVVEGRRKIYELVVGNLAEGVQHDDAKLLSSLQQLGLDVTELPSSYEMTRALFSRARLAVNKKLGGSK